MKVEKLQFLTVAGVFSAGLLAASGACAASYGIEVVDGAAPTLVAGSDVPGAFSLNAGDSLTYTLSAEAGHAWRVVNTDSLFGVFSLRTQETARRVGDVTLTLSQGGTVVKTLSAIGLPTSYAHVGLDSATLDVGMVFDSFTLAYTVTSAEAAVRDGAGHYTLTGNASATTLDGLLPILGGPSASSAISPVPEPAQYALLLLGLGVVGAVVRRRR
jgi:hypothetical protein